MDSKQLSTFLALSTSLHFGRASEVCHISISTLSRTIRQLEGELGTSLFIRDNRSVELTEAGHQFVPYAQDSLRGWEGVRRQLSATKGQLQGTVSLYCSVTAVYSLLFEWFNQLRKTYPNIDIKLHTGDPNHAIGRVSAGTEDMSIAARAGSLARGLAFKHITESPLVFIVPVEDEKLSHLPSNAQVSTCKDFVQQWSQAPFILPEHGLSRMRLDAWFKALGFNAKVYAQVAGNEAIVTMVSLGLGVGVVPEIVLNNSPVLERVKVIPVQPSLAPYDIGIFVQKKNLKNPLVDACWSLLE